MTDQLASAVVLGLVVLGLVSEAKKLIYGTKHEKVVVVLAFVISTIAVFLVGASVWAHKQVLLGEHLDTLDVASKFVVVVVVWGIAGVSWEGLGALKNIGQNQPQYPSSTGIGGPLSK